MGDLPVVDAGRGEKSPVLSRTSPTMEDLKDAANVEGLPKLEGGQESQGSMFEVTPRMKRDAILQFAVLCFSIFVSGWNDGTLGPLLPRLQAVYHVSSLDIPPVNRLISLTQVGYTIVSLIFLISCLVSPFIILSHGHRADRFSLRRVRSWARVLSCT